MNHTKEPWIAEGTVDSCHISGQTVVRQNDMTPIAYFAYDGDAKRSVACVSACAGIENPEEAIKVARWALDQALRQWKSYSEVDRCEEDLDKANHLEGQWYREAKKALALLGKERE